tara:strand:+ start:19225 stop:19947 length:723 start_codon:yes stop_codon:yes gene_type:complete
MSLSQQKESLIVFTKPALLGRVKTRLGQEIGEQSALNFHKALLKNISIVAKKVFAKRHSVSLIAAWSFEPKEHLNEFPISEWLPGPFLHTKQNGKNLGGKMLSSLGRRLAQGDNTILIGTDIPEIDERTILDSFDSISFKNKSIENNKMVIGPSKDGGFYLIGTNTYNSSIFNEIDWNSENTSIGLIENIKKINCSYTLMPEKIDIDFLNDIRSLKRKFKKNDSLFQSRLRTEIEKLDLI